MHAVSDKSVLREKVLADRRALDPHVRATADRAICASVRDLLRSGRRPGRPAVHAIRRTVACYVPTDGEPGGPTLPEVAHGWGDRVLLPVLRSDLDLDWAEYTGPDCLAPARWRLCEPTGPRLGVRAVTTASVLLIPAMLVDRAGARLGRGGGSYDRALVRVPRRTLVVALLYDGELVDGPLPTEAHDRHVNAVITPSLGFLRLV